VDSPRPSFPEPVDWGTTASADQLRAVIPILSESIREAAPLKTGFFQMGFRDESGFTSRIRPVIEPSGMRTATAALVEDRIITPSITAWPPAFSSEPGRTHASGVSEVPPFSAIDSRMPDLPGGGGGYFPVSSLRPYFLLYLSTMPAESISFCLPV